MHKVLDDPHAMMVTARTRERNAVLVGGHMPQRAYSSAFRAVMQRVHQALQKERADFVVMTADWNRHLKESGTAVHEVQRLRLCVVANGTEARLHKDLGVVHPTMQNSRVCYLPAVADHPVVVLQAPQGAVEDGRECAERGPTVKYECWSAYEKKVHSDAMELLTVPDSSVAATQQGSQHGCGRAASTKSGGAECHRRVVGPTASWWPTGRCARGGPTCPGSRVVVDRRGGQPQAIEPRRV